MKRIQTFTEIKGFVRLRYSDPLHVTFSVRHMKIHEKDPASGLLPVSPPSPNKRRRPSVKRRQEEENSEEPPTKKVCSQTHTHKFCIHT